MNINFIAYTYDKHDGYGRHARYIVNGLRNRGVGVRVMPHDVIEATRGWDADTREWAGYSLSGVTLSLLWPPHIRKIPGRQWVFTMWEDTRLPPQHVNTLNDAAERVLVPSPWCKTVFEKSGVIRPVHVVHEGIDPCEFPVLERERTDDTPFTFIALGDRGIRKGSHPVLMAFSALYGNREDVQLLIKTRDNGGVYGRVSHAFKDNPNIHLWSEDVDSMLTVYERADCMVIPSTGEGWGLPHREAAATGLPVIATNYSGLCVGIDQWGIPLNDYSLVESGMGDTPGKWAWLNYPYHELTEKMQWVEQNREDARFKGVRAAEWLREHQTWDHATDMLTEVLEQWQ